MAKNVRPSDDYVLVRKVPNALVTAGGIHLAETAQGKPQRGVVLAVGPGRLLGTGLFAPVAVSVGDVVVFAERTGVPVKVAGEELHMMRESNLDAVEES